MSLVKGNIVKLGEKHGIILAVTKDGTRANCYVYGPDVAVWRPLAAFTVVTAGLEGCYKCGGSGLFYMGGAVVNGKYTGKTGECYACQGKGKQTDADRLRCHYYWHRGGESVDDRPLEQSPQPEIKPEPIAKAPAVARKRVPARYVVEEDAPAGWEPDDEARISKLIDCPGCGCLHRSDVKCPW